MNRCVWSKLARWILGGIRQIAIMIIAICAFFGVLILVYSNPLSAAIADMIGWLLAAAVVLFVVFCLSYGAVMNISDEIEKFKVECADE